MSVQKTSGELDFEALRQAIENLVAERLVSIYADDAEMQTVNRYTAPSSPKVLKGKEQIGEYLRDVCGRAMTHHIENEVIGEGRVAFNETCEYPDGTKVLCAATLEVQDGKIVLLVRVRKFTRPSSKVPQPRRSGTCRTWASSGGVPRWGTTSWGSAC